MEPSSLCQGSAEEGLRELCLSSTLLVSLSLSCSSLSADCVDQTLPESLTSKDPTGAVFDFVFDYNMELLRRDSGPLSMRVDYSNVGGKFRL